MVLLNDTRFKRKAAIPAACLSLVILTGCTQSNLDQVRPEINQHNGMVIAPGAFDSMTELMLDDGTGSYEPAEDGIGGGGSEDGGGTGTAVSVPDQYAALPYNVVSAKDYSRYLDEQIYKPVVQRLEQLTGDSASHLYFRVYHTGYDLYNDTKDMMVRSTPYDGRKIGSLEKLGGTGVSEFALEWLIDVNNNKRIVNAARQNWLSTINKSGLTPSTAWVQAATDPTLNKTITLMWGNERLGAEHLEDYLKAVRSSVIGTVPSIGLVIRNTANSTTTVAINQIAGQTTRYQDCMNRTNVDRLFTYYNQYPDRSASPTEFAVMDDHTAMYAYVDGYSKTIVLLNAELGYTLDDLLGVHADFVTETVAGVYNNTEWSQVSGYISGATVIQKGARGLE